MFAVDLESLRPALKTCLTNQTLVTGFSLFLTSFSPSVKFFKVIFMPFYWTVERQTVLGGEESAKDLETGIELGSP